MTSSAPIRYYVDKSGNMSPVTIAKEKFGTQTSVVVRFSDGRELAVSEFDVFNTPRAAAAASLSRGTRRP